ncbi:hypothetical protein LX88_005834 [Lentzea californiensis]|nr:hypothetical protein [Lentzea californiensis]
MSPSMRRRSITHFSKADPAHGERVRKACEASGALREASAAASVSANRSSLIETWEMLAVPTLLKVNAHIER